VAEVELPVPMVMEPTRAPVLLIPQTLPLEGVVAEVLEEVVSALVEELIINLEVAVEIIIRVLVGV
jgi:hypothetical protein